MMEDTTHTNTIEFHQAEYAEVKEYALSVQETHYKELGLDNIEVNIELYDKMSELGLLLCSKMTANGNIVGYSIGMRTSTLNKKSNKILQNLLFFVDKKYRLWYNGYRFVKYQIDIAKKLDIYSVRFEAISGSSFEKLLFLMKKRGATKFSTIFDLE